MTVAVGLYFETGPVSDLEPAVFAEAVVGSDGRAEATLTFPTAYGFYPGVRAACALGGVR